jgi:hypothetical protein
MEDPAARRVVEEIRASAELLGAGFTRERVEGLDEKQRAAVGAVPKVLHLHAKKNVASAASRGWRPGWPVALGGVAALVMTGVFLFTNGKPESPLRMLGYAVADAKVAEKTEYSKSSSTVAAENNRELKEWIRSSTSPVTPRDVTEQDEPRTKSEPARADKVDAVDTNGVWGNPQPIVVAETAKIQNEPKPKNAKDYNESER